MKAQTPTDTTPIMMARRLKPQSLRLKVWRFSTSAKPGTTVSQTKLTRFGSPFDRTRYHLRARQIHRETERRANGIGRGRRHEFEDQFSPAKHDDEHRPHRSGLQTPGRQVKDFDPVPEQPEAVFVERPVVKAKFPPVRAGQGGRLERWHGDHDITSCQGTLSRRPPWPGVRGRSPG